MNWKSEKSGSVSGSNSYMLYDFGQITSFVHFKISLSTKKLLNTLGLRDVEII